jgi:hypothetical protein
MARTKNGRRIANAAADLRKVLLTQSAPASRSRARNRAPRRSRAAAPSMAVVPRIPQQMSSGIDTESMQYIDSVLSDRFVSGLHLPSPRYNGPYQKIRIVGRFQGVLGTSAGSQSFAWVINPYLMWADALQADVWASTSSVQQDWPTVCTSTSTSVNNGLPQAVSTGTATKQVLDGMLTTTTDNIYNAWVRCLGVKQRVIYTGTWNNQGGEIFAIHNAPSMPLMSYNATDAVGSAHNVDTPFPNQQQLTQFNQGCSIHALLDTFEFNWRPHDVDFVNVTNWLSADQGPATGNANNQFPYRIADYLANTAASIGHGLGQCPYGWQTGGVLVMPSGSIYGASTGIPYWVEVEAELDVNLVRANVNASTATGSSATPGTRVAHCNPIATAHIHNALAATHKSRMTMNHSVTDKSLPVVNRIEKSLATGVRRGARAAGRVVKSAAADAIASQLSRLLT